VIRHYRSAALAAAAMLLGSCFMGNGLMENSNVPLEIHASHQPKESVFPVESF
jgi:hypothetical protein